MTEQDRLRGLLILSAMQETLAKLERDFSYMRQAADDFRQDMDVLLRDASGNSQHGGNNGMGHRGGSRDPSGRGCDCGNVSVVRLDSVRRVK